MNWFDKILEEGRKEKRERQKTARVITLDESMEMDRVEVMNGLLMGTLVLARDENGKCTKNK